MRQLVELVFALLLAIFTTFHECRRCFRSYAMNFENINTIENLSASCCFIENNQSATDCPKNFGNKQVHSQKRLQTTELPNGAKSEYSITESIRA